MMLPFRNFLTSLMGISYFNEGIRYTWFLFSFKIKNTLRIFGDGKRSLTHSAIPFRMINNKKQDPTFLIQGVPGMRKSALLNKSGGVANKRKWRAVEIDISALWYLYSLHESIPNKNILRTGRKPFLCILDVLAEEYPKEEADEICNSTLRQGIIDWRGDRNYVVPFHLCAQGSLMSMPMAIKGQR